MAPVNRPTAEAKLLSRANVLRAYKCSFVLAEWVANGQKNLVPRRLMWNCYGTNNSLIGAPIR